AMSFCDRAHDPAGGDGGPVKRDSEPERSAALGMRRPKLRGATCERSAEGPPSPPAAHGTDDDSANRRYGPSGPANGPQRKLGPGGGSEDGGLVPSMRRRPQPISSTPAR